MPAALRFHVIQAHNTACVVCVLTIVCLCLCHNEILALDIKFASNTKKRLMQIELVLYNNNEILVTSVMG